ncbi:lysozyme inhibitor LprI family protein [Psychrobacter sp. AOP7-A1-24]|uniref:lysozyme inhibitor LprI family protein n=1 Tax=Psychrobacter sp. AOP7-A1-24 TaxID=3457646 RepID=UPI00402BBB02
MSVSSLNKSNLLGRTTLLLSVILATSVSSAVEPVQANFILGMDIQGQRLNLYESCAEGSVTCNNMLLVTPDLGRLLQTTQEPSKSPYAVKYYSAQTKHSLCKDGVTPCRFQGYTFEGENFDGFIDTSNHKISIRSKWTVDTYSATYKENATYLPLASQAALIDQMYNTSDKALNKSYRVTRDEVRRLYGGDMTTNLKKEQTQWVKQRSKNCGADTDHLPRTQVEKVCFIQRNALREQTFFSWID